MADLLTRADAPSPIAAADADIGLPPGTAAHALTLAARGAAAASALSGVAHAVDHDAVLAQLLLPLVVGARPPTIPPKRAGGGFVHDDTAEADAGLLVALGLGDPAVDAEVLAARAQECWLPVTPYRTMPASAADAASPTPESAHRRRAAGDVRVLDLTAMWAGPLCTMLLAGWGAAVTTVEPSVRPDGLRGSRDQFAVLDRHKQRVDIDLRTHDGRERFEVLVRAADVIVESFSARVMPNLGYAPVQLRAINPRLITVSLRAFPAGSPEAQWVAYGRGVHAASGLGMYANRPQPASIAYPDPLAGFAAFAATLEALALPDPPMLVEVTLAEVLAPLVAAGERPMASGNPAIVATLAARTAGARRWPIHPDPPDLPRACGQPADAGSTPRETP